MSSPITSELFKISYSIDYLNLSYLYDAVTKTFFVLTMGNIYAVPHFSSGFIHEPYGINIKTGYMDPFYTYSLTEPMVIPLMKYFWKNG